MLEGRAAVEEGGDAVTSERQVQRVLASEAVQARRLVVGEVEVRERGALRETVSEYREDGGVRVLQVEVRERREVLEGGGKRVDAREAELDGGEPEVAQPDAAREGWDQRIGVLADVVPDLEARQRGARPQRVSQMPHPGASAHQIDTLKAFVSNRGAVQLEVLKRTVPPDAFPHPAHFLGCKTIFNTPCQVQVRQDCTLLKRSGQATKAKTHLVVRDIQPGQRGQARTRYRQMVRSVRTDEVFGDVEMHKRAAPLENVCQHHRSAVPEHAVVQLQSSQVDVGNRAQQHITSTSALSLP
eukprot:2704859-Rhodomonas_salina.1